MDNYSQYMDPFIKGLESSLRPYDLNLGALGSRGGGGPRKLGGGLSIIS